MQTSTCVSPFGLSPRLRSRFTVTHLLGKGGFGEVYAAIEISTNLPVAIKIEKGVTDRRSSFLLVEAHIMKAIMGIECAPPPCGFPVLRYFGHDGDCSVMVMVLLGPSLDNLLTAFGSFSPKTIAMLGDQMISRLELLHSVGFLHRDIKPENFLMGLHKLSHHVYLIDFGLSNKYKTADGSHIVMAEGREFLGTTRFASFRTHKGISQSRRDDLEQLAYVLVYLCRGSLPWSALKFRTRLEKERGIGAVKEQLRLADICSKCPKELEMLLKYARDLEFDETPNYKQCRRLMSDILTNCGAQHDYMFDWRVFQPLRGLRSDDPGARSVAVGANSAKNRSSLHASEGEADGS